MSPGLRPPSRIDQLSFPLFAVDWFAQVLPETGEIWSWVAYCGGGGSAKTGVRNNIVILRNEDLPLQISTGDQAGCSVKIYQSSSQHVFLLVALGTTVRRFQLTPTCREAGHVDVGEKCEHLAVSPDGSQFAIGVGEDGRFKVYAMTEESFASPDTLLHICKAHTKSLTSIAYSVKGHRIISASRDGTAIVWQKGKLFSGMKGSLPDPPGGKPAKPQQILVRGCAFGDPNAKSAITIHSGRKSEAYISLWKLNAENKYKCAQKSLCSALPATALSISADFRILAIGVADGSAVLWDRVEWRPIKIFSSVHELPVTCIAARPLPEQFVGEQDVFQVRTGSLDCNTGLLSLETKAPKKVSMNTGHGVCGWLLFVIYWAATLAIVGSAMMSMFPHALTVCAQVKKVQGIGAATLCVIEEAVYVPPSKLGVPLPPI